MSGLFDVSVILRGDIHDLTKAMGVLTLMGLTPRTLICEQTCDGLALSMQLATRPELVELLAARLGNFIRIAAVTVVEVDPCSERSA